MENGRQRGKGFLVVDDTRHPARYSINIPEEVPNECLTRGIVSSDIEMLDAAERAGCARLELENGSSVKVIVTRHNLGSAEIRVLVRGLVQAA